NRATGHYHIVLFIRLLLLLQLAIVYYSATKSRFLNFENDAIPVIPHIDILLLPTG
ncbi:hypothetical protein KL951_005405, partial [Ogataea haglerorum]